jgi:Domain of unknown function (DUF5606)
VIKKPALQKSWFSFSMAFGFLELSCTPKINTDMEYSKLVAVTGLQGLFELISSRGDGAILRSLEENKTQFVSNRSHNFSQLESIEVYTQRDNVNLVDVFKAMETTGGSLPDAKDGNAVKKYFEKAYPEMDFERVYPSDMKKMVKWFEQLKKHNVEIKLTEIPEETEEEVKEAPVAEEQPAKKTTRKKKAE